MPFITFIYKIRQNTYYGKYMTNCISDDHEGLDTVVRPYLVNGLNKFRKQNNLSKLKTKVKIGIISLSTNNIIPTYSSDAEKKVFDFYCEDFNYNPQIYINGKEIN